MLQVPSKTETTIAVRLAEMVDRLQFEAISPQTVDAAKALVLDQLSVQVIGSTMPWVKPAVDLVMDNGTARTESTIVNSSAKVRAADAAFVNATYGQSCELDDMAFGSSGHLGTATVPVALAVGEPQRISGRAFLTAIIAGYEVMYRLLAAITPHQNERGFHSQSIAGPFAGAAITGKIMGLDAGRLTHALAIAGSHSCGPLEYDQSGGEVKRVHAGIAARGGIESALLAKHGLTGPPTIIEGKRGFCTIFATQSNPYVILVHLDKPDNIRKTWIKVYPTVAGIQTSISGVAKLVAEGDIRPSDVASIRVGVDRRTLLHGAGISRPSDVVGAQFSLAFSLALAVVKRSNDLSLYMDRTLWTDPAITAVADLVEPYADPQAAGERRYLAAIQIRLRDGRTLETVVPFPKGSPPNPLTAAERTAKARGLIGGILPKTTADELIATIEHLDELDDVSVLARLLARPESASSSS